MTNSALRARWRATTVRGRIAAAYGAAFVLLGGVLLSLVYVLSRAGTEAKANALVGLSTAPSLSPSPGVGGVTPSPDPSGDSGHVGVVTLKLSQAASQQVLIWSAVALLVMAVLAVAVGWWTAGRVLRPVHAMTAAAQRISQQNLHERIALDGPSDELKELADTFDALLARLDTAFDSQRRFIANASHELRTPLAAQRAAIQIGLEDPTPADLNRVRDALLESNRRSERLIDGLLLLAHSERDLEHHESFDLSEVIAEEIANSAVQAADAGITLTSPHAPSPVCGDRVLLGQLTANLLRNAILYNHPGGTVTVRVTSSGRGIVLGVGNTGPVVVADEIDALYEPFRRGNGRDRMATGPGHGHGLGLSIVRSIALAHGGSISAVPGPDGGLLVEVTLPAA
ncbi:sensor histidine kinase [Streptomyces sp. H27-D2]|uniref:sensor histidine kinase n=1 Tax=Streptomyces sp. H27-D2 TaxID=3046304 RepID=UPI002DBF7C4F|nr:HAMP domain-containing sensor histidine kinase [Streptomyces sp. H27-D2]MEC4017987.1 HAMP domain-containing sensor histidine kinase [Streptomyces sp. H27-D2]